MLLVLVFCAALGYLANKAHDNERLIAQAGRKFAVVEFQEWGPDWLRNWVGARYFREPVALYVPRDFAENCLPLLEEYPSIKTLGVADTDVLEPLGSDRIKLRIQVDQVRPDVQIVGLIHRHNFRPKHFVWLEKFSANRQRVVPYHSRIAKIIDQAWLKRPLTNESYSLQAFTVSFADEELELYLLRGDLNIVLLAKGDWLIGRVAMSGDSDIVPVVVDADADGSPDVGFYYSAGENGYLTFYEDYFHRISPAGFEAIKRQDLSKKYLDETVDRSAK